MINFDRYRVELNKKETLQVMQNFILKLLTVVKNNVDSILVALFLIVYKILLPILPANTLITFNNPIFNNLNQLFTELASYTFVPQETFLFILLSKVILRFTVTICVFFVVKAVVLFLYNAVIFFVARKNEEIRRRK